MLFTYAENGWYSKGRTFIRLDGQHEESNRRFSGIREKRLVEFHKHTHTHTHTYARIQCNSLFSDLLKVRFWKCELLEKSFDKIHLSNYRCLYYIPSKPFWKRHPLLTVVAVNGAPIKKITHWHNQLVSLCPLSVAPPDNHRDLHYSYRETIIHVPEINKEPTAELIKYLKQGPWYNCWQHVLPMWTAL
jgi:hypothetical protein